MQVDHILNHLEALPGFKKFEGGEQFAISDLFSILQSAHNASTEVARHLAVLARKLQPSQFEFMLKHSVCPLIQFEVPPRLCNPGELHFAKSELTSEQCPAKTIPPQFGNCGGQTCNKVPHCGSTLPTVAEAVYKV